MTTWRMHIARWIPKATNRHSDYVIKLKFMLEQAMKTQMGVAV